MAMSKPYPTGQMCIVMRCELCETDIDVNWFCKNCIKNLCENCKRMHTKIPSLCKHDIGSIGEGRKYNRDVKMLCCEHGELLQYHCKPCVKGICVKCLDTHLKHELINLKEDGEIMKKEFRTFLESKRNQIAKMNREKAAIQKHIQKYEGITDATVAEINSKFEKVVKIKESMLKKLEDKQKSEEKKLRHQHQFLEEAMSSLQGNIERSEERVSAYDSLSLGHFIRKEMAEINSVKIPAEVSLPKPPVIFHGSVFDVERILGTLKLSSTVRRPLSTLDVVSSFRCNSKEGTRYISCIACITNEKAWIASFNMPLQLVDHTGKVYFSVELTPFAVYLAVSSSGEAVISTGKADPVKTKIKKISPSGFVSEFTKVKLCQYVGSLAIDSELNLLCLIEDTNQNLQLAKFDDKGKEIWKTTIEKNMKNNSFYTTAVCISPDGNCNVVMGKKSLVVSTDGTVIETKLFDESLGIIGPKTYDSSGYIIVGTKNGKIHVLNKEMKLLKTFTLQDKFSIYALEVDSDDRLWIGRDDGKVIIAKYLHLES